MDKPVPLFREVIWPENCQVHFPESKAFADATLRWSTYKPPNFAAVAVPQNEDAVATIVSKSVCAAAMAKLTVYARSKLQGLQIFRS